MENLDGPNNYPYENPLNNMRTMDILSELENYKKVDLKRISDDGLFNLTLDTLPCLSILSRSLIEGTKLYRIRGKEPNKSFRNISEVSYPAPNFVTRMQRLNEIGQPMLYASLDQATPFFEAKAEVGQSFALTEFEVIKDNSIQATLIGLNEKVPDGGLNEQGKINYKILEQFLYTEFTKDVGVGTEYLYRISIMLAKNFFDIPNCDGYMYPSVPFKKGSNVAVKPKSADSKLMINKVTNLTVVSMSDKGNVDMQIESESFSIDSDGKIIYK